MTKRKYNDARKRASEKYIKNKTDRVTIIAPKGARRQWDFAAKWFGYASLNAFFKAAIDAVIGSDDDLLRALDELPQEDETDETDEKEASHDMGD